MRTEGKMGRVGHRPMGGVRLACMREEQWKLVCLAQSEGQWLVGR